MPFQPHAADMLKHGRAVTRHMLSEPDGAPLGLAEQSGEPSLALDRRQVAQVVVVMLDQVDGVQHRLMATASAPQRMEVGRPVVAGDHHLAADQERFGLEASGGFDNSREAVAPIMAIAREAADARAIPAHHGGRAAFDGRHGLMKPGERRA